MAIYVIKDLDKAVVAPQCGCSNVHYKDEIGMFECVKHSNIFGIERSEFVEVVIFHEQVVTKMADMV